MDDEAQMTQLGLAAMGLEAPLCLVMPTIPRGQEMKLDRADPWWADGRDRGRSGRRGQVL